MVSHVGLFEASFKQFSRLISLKACQYLRQKTFTSVHSNCFPEVPTPLEIFSSLNGANM